MRSREVPSRKVQSGIVVESPERTLPTQRDGIAQEYRKKRRRWHRARLARRSASFLVIGIIWEVMGHTMSPLLFAKLSSTVVAFGELVSSGELAQRFLVSAPSLAIGYSLGIVVGVPLGLIMGRYSLAEHLFDNYLTILLATPMITVVPLAIMLFGLGLTSRVAVVFMFVVPNIAVNTFRGARATEAELLEMSRSFLLSEAQTFRFLILRSAAPLIFAGLRVGFGLAVTGMILGEMVLLNVGIGGMLLDLSSRYLTADLFATILALLLMAIVGQSLIELLDRRVNHWTETREKIL